MLGSRKTDNASQGGETADSARLRLALSASESAVYEWVAAGDAMSWSGDLGSVFGPDPVGPWTTGKAYCAAMTPEIVALRDAALDDANRPDPFVIEYPVESIGRRVLWVEERGWRTRDAKGHLTRVVGVIRNVTDSKRTEARLRYLASFDELTGLHNRMRLREAVAGTIDSLQGEATQVPGAYMIVGIDHLGLINQAYGYETADQVIVSIGQRITALLRDGDVLGRSAGNKFGILLPQRTVEELTEFARRVREAVRTTIIDTPRGAVCATVSAGAVMLPDGARSSEEAMARAEEALDMAKRSGRDSYRLYEVSAQRDSLRRRLVSTADQVVAALNDRRIVLAYQPILSSGNLEYLLSECLMRMIQPDGQIVTAGEFVPLCERIGLISLIDQRALELAIDTLKKHPTQKLSLNVSGMTASDSGWLEGFLAHLRANQDVADRLTIELTETAALQDLETSAQFMSNLRRLGCKVAIDDFGAGYTSFRNLQVFEIDAVKIDGSFVQGLATSPDNQLFVRTLVSLAKNFGVMVVAECVGNEEEAEILRRMGVDGFQGFHFGRPEIEPDWIVPNVTTVARQIA